MQILKLELSELNQYVEQLTKEITSTKSFSTYQEEAKIWKKKKQLMVKKQNVNHYRNDKVPKEQQLIQLLYNKIVTQQILKDSGYMSSSLIQIDIEKLQSMQKPLQL